MSGIVQKFFAWYERHYTLNVVVALTLFLWQLVHLYWLGADVIAERLTGVSYFNVTPLWQYLLIVVDYTEIPAIVATSLLYINELRRGKAWRPILLLILLNSQWLHLFWITDEFVVNSFAGAGTILPVWLAWAAILIDYLEVPVILDIVLRFVKALKSGQASQFVRKEVT